MPDVLSTEQRVALFGRTHPDDVTITVSVVQAGTGLALLAGQHLARRLLQKRGPKQLTAQDQMALRLVAQISAEVKRKPGAGDQQSPRAAASTGDPIQDLLNGPADGDTEVTVTASTGR